ncbi:TPA: hypothetical protein ACQ98W_004820, partial [Citrobacter braakii]
TEKNLYTQKLFWLSIGFPLFSFFYFGIFSWWGKTPVLSAHGYARFYEISKFPLLILASTAPLGAIVNNIHRTIQTEKQIEEANRKGLSDSYYSHFKHIVDYFTSLPYKKITLDVSYHTKFEQEFKIAYPIHLYQFIYNKNSPENGILNTNNLYMSQLSDTLVAIVDELEHITPPKSTIDNNLQLQARALNKIEEKLTQLHKMMCIDIPNQDYHFYYENPNKDFYIRTNFGSAEELAARIDVLYQFIIHIYEITVYFDFSDLLREDTGHLMTRLKLLRDISAEIFRVIKFQSGTKSPSFYCDPHTEKPSK